MSSPVEQIKERLDIVDVISGYLKLERAGANHKARCPFHSEKTPSFFVSPSRQTFHCFGCNKGGDMFTFVQEFEGLDFPGSLKVLADRAGIKIEQRDRKTQSRRERLFRVTEAAARFFEISLTRVPEAREYLRERGLSDETVATFRIGCARPGWRNLREAFAEKGASDGLLEEAGLVIRSEKGSFYDRFRGRIMFPLADSSGRVVGFSGRLLPSDEDPKTASGAKYINTPETELYDKSRILYGLDKAKSAIRKAGSCVVVEGQMDVVLSHQAGVENAVAVSGTALSRHHLALIKRLADRIVFAFDPDEAGFSAVERGIDLALETGFDVRVARLPGQSDPADLALSDPHRWKRSVAEAEHIIDFLTDALAHAKNGTRDAHLAISATVLPYVARLPNRMEQAHFVSKISQTLGIGEEPIWQEMSKAARAQNNRHHASGNVPEEDPAANENVARRDRIKEKIIGILLWQGGAAHPAFDTKPYTEQLKTIIGKAEYQRLVEGRDDESKKELVFEAEVYYEGADDLKHELGDLVAELEREFLKQDFAGAMAQLKKAEQDGDEKQALLMLKKCHEISKKLGEIVHT